MFSGFIDTLMYGQKAYIIIYIFTFIFIQNINLITPFFLCLKSNKKKQKGRKVHAVFYQVRFILILYGEYNGNEIQ
jgi:hypothetical protein